MAAPDVPDELDAFEALVLARRTSMVVDLARPVPHDLVRRLCTLAQWAPNHKRTWPWRFVLVEGDGRARLGAVVADAVEAHGDPPEKVAKARTKYLRTPAHLVVGAAAGESPLRTRENRDAVAAGVQNLLLGATAAGLASFWSSCPKGAERAVTQFCGWPDDTDVVALIYLGWAAGDVAVPERPPVEVPVVDG